MSVTITLIEITPEIWKDTAFQNWISGGVEEGEIPENVPEFRHPTLSDIEAILEEFKAINVEQTRTKRQLQIVFSKSANYLNLGEIYVTTTLPSGLASDTPVGVRIERSDGEQINRFIQQLANRCGVYLLLYNGEPVEFFVPQTD